MKKIFLMIIMFVSIQVFSQVEIKPPMDLDTVSNPVITMIAMNLEDSNFYYHNGIDWIQFGKSVVNNEVVVDTLSFGPSLSNEELEGLYGLKSYSFNGYVRNPNTGGTYHIVYDSEIQEFRKWWMY